VVAVPTETYYGLAADPFNQDAVESLYHIKQRSRDLPILLLIDGPEQLPLVVSSVPAVYKRLMTRFWPGPLTLVCPAQPAICPQLTGGTGTVGVRHSPHPVANRVLQLYGRPITATSANLSGMVPAVTAEEVDRFFADRIDLIIDGGGTPGGKGSTLVGMHGLQLCCLREGQIAFSQIQQFLSPSTFASVDVMKRPTTDTH
jgi:L-threonylcarbamoyladenylate synthase